MKGVVVLRRYCIDRGNLTVVEKDGITSGQA